MPCISEDDNKLLWKEPLKCAGCVCAHNERVPFIEMMRQVDARLRIHHKEHTAVERGTILRPIARLVNDVWWRRVRSCFATKLINVLRVAVINSPRKGIRWVLRCWLWWHWH